MIACAALAGTMVAARTVGSPAAAALPDEDAFPAAFKNLAQARMAAAKPLALNAKAAQSAATQQSPTATRRDPEVDAKQPPAPIASSTSGTSGTSSTSGTSGTSIPTTATTSAPPSTAADGGATKGRIAKAVTASGAPPPSKEDLHKVLAGGTPHTDGADRLPPANEAPPSSTALSGEHREASQPTQGAPQASADPGSILPPSVAANAATTKTGRQPEHSAPAKLVSAYASPMTASDAENGVAGPTASAADAASAGEGAPRMQPDEVVSFKAELSLASQQSGHDGHGLAASTEMPPNPLSNPHSAGVAFKPAGLAETGGEAAMNGAASYSGSLPHESHGTLVATPTTLEVGVPRGAEGWLKIRAEVGSEGISASLSTASHAGQSMLRDQLPAINAFLQGEQIHASATVLDKASQPSASDGSSSAAMDRGLGQEGRAQREQPQLSQTRDEAPELPENSHSVSLESGVGVLLPAESARAGASLSVLA